MLKDSVKNPRYVLYVQAHGRTFEEQLEFDKQRYPGGANAGFILWMQEQWADFDNSHVISLNMDIHKKFDEWLEAKVMSLLNSGGQN